MGAKKDLTLMLVFCSFLLGFVEFGHGGLDDGLVAYYPFENNANDESGNGHHGIVYGSPLFESGIKGSALHLNADSEDDYIQVSGLSIDSKPLSIIAWVKPDYRYDANNGYQSYESKYPNNIISGDKQEYGGYGFGLNYRSDVDQLEFQIETHDGTAHHLIELLGYDPSVFHFIATVYDANEVRTYRGSSRGSSAGLPLSVSVLTNDGLLDGNKDYTLIGRHNFDPGWDTKNAFKGRIDEVRIYNRALSESEIQELYNFSPSPTVHLPVKPVPSVGEGDPALDYGVHVSWAVLPHNGVDYSSNLSDEVKSVGKGIVHSYTKPDARWFGSINPDGRDGRGPAIWVRYKLETGEPIYVLYGHTATSWNDISAWSKRRFKFNCAYSIEWQPGDIITTGEQVGLSAPFYHSGIHQEHLHMSVFKPKKMHNGNYYGPPSSGWGYSELSLPTGDYIDPKIFSAEYYLTDDIEP